MASTSPIPEIHIRRATDGDSKAIEALMKRSMRTLGQGHYSPEQIESCCRHVAVPDQQLISDGTFFVVETSSGEMVGCGGWSFRNTLYAGPKQASQDPATLNPKTDPARIRAMFVDPSFGGKGIGSLILAESERAAKAYGFLRGCLGATLSGLAFYKAKGWTALDEEQATLPDGISISVVYMEKGFS